MGNNIRKIRKHAEFTKLLRTKKRNDAQRDGQQATTQQRALQRMRNGQVGKRYEVTDF